MFVHTTLSYNLYMYLRCTCLLLFFRLKRSERDGKRKRGDYKLSKLVGVRNVHCISIAATWQCIVHTCTHLQNTINIIYFCAVESDIQEIKAFVTHSCN